MGKVNPHYHLTFYSNLDDTRFTTLGFMGRSCHALLENKTNFMAKDQPYVFKNQPWALD